MLKVTLEGNFKKLERFEKDLRFAAASTLTKIAGMSQDAADIALQTEFHIRRPWWKHGARYGIKIKKATKADLESAVYTRADWLLEAEGFSGGVKRPDKHAGHLAVPNVQETRHGIQNVVRRTEKARYLLDHAQQTRAFKIQTRSGYTLIVQRKGGRGGRGGRTSRLVTKYIFRDRVKVPHQSAIVKPTHLTVATFLGQVWDKQFVEAFKPR